MKYLANMWLEKLILLTNLIYGFASILQTGEYAKKDIRFRDIASRLIQFNLS